MRQLTTDNNVSVSFDPFVFSVNDFHMGIPLMRYYSLSNLYLTTTFYPFAGLAYNLWHSRLGQPKSSNLQSLHRNKFISYEHLNSITVCVSYVFGKNVRLPLVSSNNVIVMPFDILHIDLWTSSVLSPVGQSYYVSFLDDFSDFEMFTSLSNKSHAFEMFTSLSN